MKRLLFFFPLFVSLLTAAQTVEVRGIRVAIVDGGTQQPTQLAAPSLSANAVGTTAIDIMVGSVANAASYSLEWSINNSTWLPLASTAGVFHHLGLTSQTTYYYRVRANGDASTYGNSNFATASATTSAGSFVYTYGTNAYLATYLNAAGLGDTTLVLYPGTPEQRTVGQALRAFNPLFNFMQSRGALPGTGPYPMTAAYLGLGNNFSQAKVNALNPGTYDLTAPNSITVNQYGFTGNGQNQTIFTGIYPMPALYPMTYPQGQGVQPGPATAAYPDSMVRGFLAIYSSGSQAYVTSNASSSASWRLEDFGGYAYYDMFGELGNNRVAGGHSGAVGLLVGNRTDANYFEIWRNSTVLSSYSGHQSGISNFASAEIKLGNASSTQPFRLAFVSRYGYSSAFIDSFCYYITYAVNQMGWTAVAPAVASAPTDARWDSATKQIFFKTPSTSTAGYTELSDYELSKDGGDTYAPVPDSLGKKIRYPGGQWFGEFVVYVGNNPFSAGQLKVRTKAHVNVLPSPTISSDVPYVITAGYDRWRPYAFNYLDNKINDYGDVRNYKIITWSDAYTPDDLSRSDDPKVDARDYQVSYNYNTGTPIWEPAPTKSIWVGDRTIPAGGFAVRRVNPVSGAVMSSPLISTFAINAGVVTNITQTLRARDTTCTATTTAGSNVIVLNKNAYNLVGDGTEYIVLDNNAAPGHGLRKTIGMNGTWPYLRFADTAAAAAAWNSGQYPGDGWWCTIEGDWKARRKTSVQGVGLDAGDRTGWYPVFPDPAYEYCYALTLRAKVTGIVNNGNGTYNVTIDKAPQLSTTGTIVHFDNAPIINQTLADAPDFGKWTLTAGDYDIASVVSVNRKHGLDLEFRGVTWRGIATQVCSVFFTECNGLRINKGLGTAKFQIKGTVDYDHSNLPFLPGLESPWNDAWVPTTNQSFTNLTVYVPGIGTTGTGGKFFDMEVADCAWLNIYNKGIDNWYYRCKSVRNNVIVWLGHNVAYFGPYYWSFQFDGSIDGGIDGTQLDGTPGEVFHGDKWINGLEFFIAKNPTLKNAILYNACSALNSTIGSRFENVTWIVKPGSRSFQETVSYPIFDYNNRIRSWITDARPNYFKNLKFIIEGNVASSGPEVYPAGFQNNNSLVPVYIDTMSYTHPDINGIEYWRSCAYSGYGNGSTIKNFTATGNWGNAHLTNEPPNSNKASIAVGNASDIGPVTFINVNVPTAYVGGGHSLTNFVTTELPIVQPAYLNAGADAVINGNTFTFQPSMTPASGTTITGTEWIFKGATYSNGTEMPYNGKSTTTVAIPVSYPQSISLTTQANLLMPVGANVYLYNSPTGKQIEAKVTSYNASTGALVVNATTAGGATGTYNAWEIISEPLIGNIYNATSTVSGLLTGRYTYQLKATSSNGDVVRDNMDIIVQSN